MNVNLRFKGNWAALAIIFLAPLAGIQAQTAGGAAAPSKIGVLNVRNAIVATAEGKQAQALLQSQFAPKQNELQSTQKQIEDLQRKLADGARTLSDEEKAKLQRQGELLTRRLQRDNDGLNEELNAARSEPDEERRETERPDHGPLPAGNGFASRGELGHEHPVIADLGLGI